MASPDPAVRWHGPDAGPATEHRTCSVPGCEAVPSAVREHRWAAGRASRWSGYCRAHAAMYGVLVHRGQVMVRRVNWARSAG